MKTMLFGSPEVDFVRDPECLSSGVFITQEIAGLTYEEILQVWDFMSIALADCIPEGKGHIYCILRKRKEVKP